MVATVCLLDAIALNLNVNQNTDISGARIQNEEEMSYP